MSRNQSRVDISDNISWTIEKGSWMMHFIITAIIYLLLSQFFGVSLAWQLTSITYNISTFIFFHCIVGDPFNTNYREYTFWEQVAVQIGQSRTLLFMSLFPVFLLGIVNRLVVWNTVLYYIAIVSLFLVVIPKLSFMHLKRVFGIKQYN